MIDTSRPLWRCPKCGGRFVTRNLPHSCVKASVEDFLRGKPKPAVALFRHYVRACRKIGPVTLHPVKTRVALMVKVRFSAVDRIAKNHIVCHLWLKGRHPSRKFHKIEHYGGDNYGHHFRLTAGSDIDADLMKYMRMAYAIGERKHLSNKES